MTQRGKGVVKGELSRQPPKAVRDELCREVGFRCPIDGCDLPYLTFHHFAPPWRVKKHHDPEGMIALCSAHAAKADGGYYPDDYLVHMKSEASARPLEVRSDYLRKDLVVFIGNILYYHVETLIEIDGEPCVFFNRDELGYLLLNFTMPSINGAPRARMEDNVWTIDPGAKHVECPPRGRYLKVHFDNGDMFHIEWKEVEDALEFERRYPDHAQLSGEFTYPLSIARLYERSSNGIIEFGALATNLPNRNVISGGSMIDCKVGISLHGVGALNSGYLSMLNDVRMDYNNRCKR